MVEVISEAVLLIVLCLSTVLLCRRVTKNRQTRREGGKRAQVEAKATLTSHTSSPCVRARIPSLVLQAANPTVRFAPSIVSFTLLICLL